MKGRIRIVQDESCEWDTGDPVRIACLKSAREWYGDTPVSNERMAEIRDGIASGKFIGMPVWVYSHSGACVRAAESNPFSCPWDSGQSGFVYVSLEDARESWGKGKSKRLTKTALAHVRECLVGTVKSYDDWQSGNVWGFVVEETEDASGADFEEDPGACDWKETDSCWGFYGHDWKKNGMADHIQHHVDAGYEVVGD